jgi:hypothetical protein
MGSQPCRLVLLLVAGCALGAPPPAAPRPPTTTVVTPSPPVVELVRARVVPGERLAYDVTFRGIDVGRLDLTIGAPGLHDGRAAVVVQTRAVGTGVVELISDYVGELTSTIDLEDGVSLALRTEEWFSILGEPHYFTYARTYPRDEHHLETHAAFAAIRAWSSRPGDRAKVTVDVAGEGIEVSLLDTGRVIYPRTGTPAVRYTGSFTCGCGDTVHFSLWISDDVARAPLRIHARTPWGTARADLVDYVAPGDPY